ncbi:MAG TPA: DUF2948 family protein [Aestuariivirgaceae bacterium]
MSDAAFLKLAAFDADDLQVISAQMQDAVIKVGDMTYLPRQRKLALVANRFDWDDSQGKRSGPYLRRLTGLQFARVQGVRSRRIRREQSDAVLELLSIDFEAGNPPGGTVVLRFAGGGDLSLDVECIEAMLEDLGPQWVTSTRPAHGTSEAR